MIEANRTIYRDKDSVVPIMMNATQQAAGRGRICLGSPDQELHLVGQRRLRSRPYRSGPIDHDVANGDIDPATEADGRAGLRRHDQCRRAVDGGRPADDRNCKYLTKLLPPPRGDCLSTNRRSGLMKVHPPRRRSAVSVGRGPRHGSIRTLPFANMRGTPLLPRRRLRAILQGRNMRAATPPCATRCASTSSTRHRAWRSQSLELRRRHAVADRPLGMACALPAMCWCRSRRADADLFHGRHACGGGAARSVERRCPTCVRAATAAMPRSWSSGSMSLDSNAAAIGLSRSIRVTKTTCRSTSTTICAQACRTRSSCSPAASCTNLLVIQSEDELDCVRKAGVLCAARHGGDGRGGQAGRDRI